MKKVSVLAFLLLAFPASYASAIIINDPSALPSIDNANGFVSSSTEKAGDFISASPLIPVNQESDVKFGYQKPVQPYHVTPIPERRGPVLLPKIDDSLDQKQFVLKHNPSLPKEEIVIPSMLPIIPSSHIPVVPQQPIIPVTESQLPSEETPHKTKHRRPHVPKPQRKHVPHVPKHHCECPIPIIPDHTKPKRRHHEPRHTRKTERRQHVSHPVEEKL